MQGISQLNLLFIHSAHMYSLSSCCFMFTPVSQTGGCEVLPSQKMKKDERLVGHAFYFYTYSTTVGKVLYLEDLFVRTEYRSKLYSMHCLGHHA